MTLSSTPNESLTPWFPEDITPIREGVYEVDEIGGSAPAYAYWDGERFGYRCWSYPQAGDSYCPIDSAFRCRNLPTSLAPRISWRGLASKP